MGNATASSGLCPSLIVMEGDKEGCTEESAICRDLSSRTTESPLSGLASNTWQEPGRGARCLGTIRAEEGVVPASPTAASESSSTCAPKEERAQLQFVGQQTQAHEPGQGALLSLTAP